MSAEGGVPEFEPDLDTGATTESLRDRLQRERRELAAMPGTLDLVVPRWDSVLVRYHTIDPDEFEKFAKEITGKNKARSIVVVCRFLTRCCDSILVRVEEGGTPEELTDDAGTPLKFDKRLADYLGFEAEKPGEVILGLFMADKHPLAPAEHANALMDWMRGRFEEIDEALLGE